MKIAILGAGNVDGALGRIWASKGHGNHQSWGSNHAFKLLRRTK
jgi:predicted dinucleotide-binding enzyme